jgi:hypothetical protein
MIRIDARRRTLLKALGAGAGLLPLLRGSKASGAAPKRLLCAVQVGGYVQASWRPPVGPLDAALPVSAEPLTAHKGDLIFLPDLTCPAALANAPAYDSMFSAGTQPRAPAEKYSVTVDQVVGAALAGGRMNSLPLGVQLQLRPLDGEAAGGRFAFAGATGALIDPQLDPYAVHANLFGGAATPTAVQRLLAERKSILDYVGKSLEQFKVLVGRDYRPAIDQHLALVREVENQIDAGAGSLTRSCGGTLPSPPLDLQSSANFLQILDLQMNVAVIALACGITPVATLQLTDSEAGNVQLPLLGAAKATWRQVARESSVARKLLLDRLCMQKLADLLDRLAGASDGVSTLLDSTVVLWANDMDDGRTRNGQKLPWILATRAGGYFKTGQCAASAGKPVLGLLAEVCNSLGVANHPFGPPLAGLH